MFSKLACFTLLLAANSAWTCQVNSAHIKGSVAGARYENDLCVVTVTLNKATPTRNCPLSVRAEQEITIAVDLPERECPMDSGTVDGTVSTGGRYLNFRGSLDGYRVR